MTRGPAKQFDPAEAVDQAMNVFWAKGYVGAGLNELLDAMGISRKSLYVTFGSNRGLFLQARDHYVEEFVGRVIKTLESDGSPLKNVRKAFEQLDAPRNKSFSNGCLIGVTMGQFRSDEPEIAEAIRKHLQVIEDAYYRTLKRALKAGELNPKANPRDLARMLTATSQGLTMRRRIDENPAKSRSIIRATMALLDALGPSPSS